MFPKVISIRNLLLDYTNFEKIQSLAVFKTSELHTQSKPFYPERSPSYFFGQQKSVSKERVFCGQTTHCTIIFWCKICTERSRTKTFMCILPVSICFLKISSYVLKRKLYYNRVAFVGVCEVCIINVCFFLTYWPPHF